MVRPSLIGAFMNGISYLEDRSLWWPDYDYDPVKCLSFVMKGLKDSDLAIQYCRHRNVAVQAGGHVGLWPKRLAQTFKTVYAFECEPMLAECMRRNCQDTPNVLTFQRALGAFDGEVKMRGAVSAGSWSIDVAGKHTANQTTIDTFELAHCDAIFLDVEAYEVEVLRGATRTIAQHKPVIMVEELPRSTEAIHAHMRALSYRAVKKIHNDVIYVPVKV
jgi:FkbM family methyltransferase